MLKKINMGINADFQSVEKVEKKFPQKKLLTEMCQKYALFPILLMCVKLVCF